jgi:hypothetical protein
MSSLDTILRAILEQHHNEWGWVSLLHSNIEHSTAVDFTAALYSTETSSLVDLGSIGRIQETCGDLRIFLSH